MRVADVYEEGESWKTGSSAKFERMNQYIEWILTPKDARRPSTKKEFAKLLDVTPQTLANYEKELYFQKEVDKRSRGYFKAASMPDVISTLVKVATDVEHKQVVSAGRLLLEWQDKVVRDDTPDLTDLNLQELLEKVQEIVGNNSTN